MKYVQCPEVYNGNEKSIFLAGGISGCSVWQTEMANLLKDTDLAVINPRRENYDMDDKSLEEVQIKWEFDHMNKVDIISFWFTPETVCPITLYELGKASMTNKIIFVGVDPNYSRKRDVEIQTKLIRPEIKIVSSIKELVEQVKNGIQ